MVGIFLAVNQK